MLINFVCELNIEEVRFTVSEVGRDLINSISEFWVSSLYLVVINLI